MMFFKSHFFSMCVFAVVSSVVFACIMRDKRRDRIRFALLLAASMIGGTIAVGWLLYPFP